jgi:hypothetical protein
MATTKKKPVAKKKTAKAIVSSPRRAVKKPAKKPSVQSFKPSGETAPFLTFKPTQQTAYWLILSVMVISLGAWVMYLDMKVQQIYDQIDLNTASLNTIQHPVKKPIHK